MQNDPLKGTMRSWREWGRKVTEAAQFTLTECRSFEARLTSAKREDREHLVLCHGLVCPVDIVGNGRVYSEFLAGVQETRKLLEAPEREAQERRAAEFYAEQKQKAEQQEAEYQRRRALIEGQPILCKKDLLERGWTRKQIAALGEPDWIEKLNVRYGAREYHWFLQSRIKAVEASRK